MEERKNLCAQIPVSLHTQVRQDQEKSGKNLSEYITEVLTAYYKGGSSNMANNKTLAIQVPEELLERIKKHLVEESQRQGRKISQREFIVGLIEDALKEE